jgi:hypothetical protein
MGLYQTKSILNNKENNQQNEEKAYGAGENICKPCI